MTTMTTPANAPTADEVKSLLDYVYKLADGMVGGEDPEYRSAAHTGLAKALRDFDPSRGTSLRQYARLRARGEVLNALKEAQRFRQLSETEWAAQLAPCVRADLHSLLVQLPEEDADLAHDHWVAEISERDLARVHGVSRRKVREWLSTLAARLKELWEGSAH